MHVLFNVAARYTHGYTRIHTRTRARTHTNMHTHMHARSHTLQNVLLLDIKSHLVELTVQFKYIYHITLHPLNKSCTISSSSYQIT